MLLKRRSFTRYGHGVKELSTIIYKIYRGPILLSVAHNNRISIRAELVKAAYRPNDTKSQYLWQKNTNKQTKKNNNYIPQTERSFLIKLAVGNNLMSSERANLSWGSLADHKDTRIWEWKWLSLPTSQQFRAPFATSAHSTFDFRLPAPTFDFRIFHSVVILFSRLPS